MKLKKIVLINTLVITAVLSGCQKNTPKNTETSPVVNEESQTQEELNTTEAAKEAEVSKAAEDKKKVADTIDSNDGNSEKETGESITTYLMDTPPFKYYIADGIEDKLTHPLKLTELDSKKNQITDESEWIAENNLIINSFKITDFYQSSNASLPSNIDATWNDFIITSAFYDDAYIYCTYGADYSEGRVLKIYEANSQKEVYCLDFSKYSYSPEYKESDYDYIQQKINGAAIKDNILYISHSHNTYAISSNGMNAYITAIDLSDMKVLWRSEALVSNAYNILIVDDVIISGYGFTDEADYLYQLDRTTGKVLDKTLLATAASYIILKEEKLYVRTYNRDYVFEITR